MSNMHNNATLIRGHIQVAKMAYRSGEYHAAYRNLFSAIYELEDAGNSALNDLDQHELKYLLGKVNVALRQYETAEQAFREAIDFAERRKIPAELIISDLRHLADCVRLRDRYDESETIYEKCRKMLGDFGEITGHDVQMGKIYLGLTQVYIDGHKLEKAEKMVNLALSMFEKVGMRSYWSGRTMVTLARLRWEQTKVEESKEELQKALDILEPLIGPHHPLRAMALRRLSDVLRCEGNERSAQAIQTDLKEVEKYLKDHDL